MTNTIRVALPGYNALTDTDPDHFALYADEDWVLIKEKQRGSVDITASSSTTITHGLGYIPMVLVFGKLANDKWSLLQGDSGELTASIELSTTTLKIWNNSIVQKTFKYYIFYDQIT